MDTDPYTQLVMWLARVTPFLEMQRAWDEQYHNINHPSVPLEARESRPVISEPLTAELFASLVHIAIDAYETAHRAAAHG